MKSVSLTNAWKSNSSERGNGCKACGTFFSAQAIVTSSSNHVGANELACLSTLKLLIYDKMSLASKIT